MILSILLLVSVGCYGQVLAEDMTFVCPADSGTFPHPDTNTRFYRCVAGQPVLHICTTGTFVASKGLCTGTEDTERTANSEQSTTVTTELSTGPSSMSIEKAESGSTALLQSPTASSSQKTSIVTSQPPPSTTNNPPSTSTANTATTTTTKPQVPGSEFQMTAPSDEANDVSVDGHIVKGKNEDRTSQIPKTISTTQKALSTTTSATSTTTKITTTLASVGEQNGKPLAKDTHPKADTFRAQFDHESENADQEDYRERLKEAQRFVCPSEVGFFRHPTNCSRFFWCIDHKPTPMFCSEGTAFDPETNVCSWAVGEDGCGGMLDAPTFTHRRKRDATIAKMAAEAKRMEHSSGHGGSVRIHRQRRQARQRGNFHHHRTGRRGEDGGKEKEGRGKQEFSSSVALFQCPGDGFYADPNNCSIFYHCSNGKAYSHNCQPGTAFNKDKFVCSWPVNSDGCGGMLSVPYRAQMDGGEIRDSAFQCPDDIESYYPDPKDCRNFFRCIHGKASRHRCGNGTAFNKDKGVCVWPVELDSGCGASLLPPHLLPSQTKPQPAHPSSSHTASPFLPGHEAFRGPRDFGTRPATTMPDVLLGNRGSVPQKIDRSGSLSAQFSARRPHLTDRKSNLSQKMAKNAVPIFPIQYKVTAETKTISHKSDHSPQKTEQTLSKIVTLNQKQNDNHSHHKNLHASMNAGLSAPVSPHVKKGSENYAAPWTKSENTAINKGLPAIRKASDSVSVLPRQDKSGDVRMEESSKEAGTVQEMYTWPWESVVRRNQKAFPPRQTSTTNPKVSTTTTTTTPSTTSTSSPSPIPQRPSSTPFSAQPPSPSAKAVSSGRPTSSVVTDVTTSAITTATTATTSTTAPTSNNTTTRAVPASEPSRNAVDEVKAEPYRLQGAETPFRCPSPSGQFRDLANCAVYYQCIGGVAYRKDCPSGRLYDITEHQCLPINQVMDCELVEEEQPMWGKQWLSRYPEMDSYPAKHDIVDSFQCKTLSGYYKDTQDCTAYVECIDGLPYHRKCMPGTVFDVSRKKCTWSSLVPDCRMVAWNQKFDDGLDVSDFKCPSADGYYRDPYSCTSYYHCIDGRAMGRKCDPNFFFDPMVSKCRWEKLVSDCDPSGHPLSRDKLPLSAFVCPLPNGHYRDPDDCSVFYHCLLDVPYHGACRSHHAFDLETLTCVPQDQVPGCEKNNKSLGTGVEENAWDVSEDENDGTTDVPEQSRDETGPHHVEQQNVSLQVELVTFKCPKAHGLYRDPNDCRIFYHCFGGRHFRHECQFGTVFSRERNLCTWPLLVSDCPAAVPPDTRPPPFFSSTTRDSTSQQESTTIIEHRQIVQNDGPSKSPKPLSFLYDVNFGERANVTGNEVGEKDTGKEGGYLTQDFAPRPMDPILPEALDNTGLMVDQFQERSSLVPQTLPVVTDSYSDFICPQFIFDQYFRDPIDCTRFHRCVKGLRFTFDCPRGTFFEPVLNICDFQEKLTDCDHEGKRLGSSQNFGGLYGNVPMPVYTGDSREYMSEPGPPGEKSSHMCSSPDGLFSHPSSCQKFVYCTHGSPVILTCPSGLLYNINTMTCDYDDNTVCTRYDK